MSDYLVKLIRDHVPGEGGTIVFAPLGCEDYRRELRHKLAEEVHEYLESNEPGALADVLAAVEALASSEHELTLAELWELELIKRKARGGFDLGVGMFVRNP